MPENSSLILRSVGEYLDRVISQCRSTGDSREASFTSLREILTQDITVIVQTACALRSLAEIIEQLPLIDQAHGVRIHGLRSYGSLGEDTAPEVLEHKQQPFQGVVRLDVERVKSLGRCVLILDAVIRGQDHSASTCHSWRNKAPLKRVLRHANGNPILRNLVMTAGKSGLTLDFEALLAELVVAWAQANYTLEEIRNLICDYFPVASRIRGSDRMERVFEEARNYRKATQTEVLTESPVS